LFILEPVKNYLKELITYKTYIFNMAPNLRLDLYVVYYFRAS
jgi:hypothetical protein